MRVVLLVLGAVSLVACTACGGNEGSTSASDPGPALAGGGATTSVSAGPTAIGDPATTTQHVLESVPSTVPPSTVLAPAVDAFLGQLRLDVTPREDVRVAVGGLREVDSGQVGPRQRLIEGEVIIENRSLAPFAYEPNDFSLFVGPFEFQIAGMTASTGFPVAEAWLTPVEVDGHPFMSPGRVAPGSTLRGYLLNWVADRGTSSTRLQYDPSDPESGGSSFVFEIMP